jgi:uncharacterized protein involved in exopolysaccharide biosynthesis
MELMTVSKMKKQNEYKNGRAQEKPGGPEILITSQNSDDNQQYSSQRPKRAIRKRQVSFQDPTLMAFHAFGAGLSAGLAIALLWALVSHTE